MNNTLDEPIQKNVFQTLAYKVLIDLPTNTSIIHNDVLETLHCFFGETLILATELLDKCKITQYQTIDPCRKILKIFMPKDQYTIYEDINFCTCKQFQLHVLENETSLTCKHVLAVKLGQILGKTKTETLTNSQMADFLNEQLNFVDEEN